SRPRPRGTGGGRADRAQPLQCAQAGGPARRLARRPRRRRRAAPRRRGARLRRMSTPPPTRLVLASASPRRLELLRRLDLEPEGEPAHVDETPETGETAEEYVLRGATDKAEAVAGRRPGALVRGADTAVVLDGVPLGKPADRDEALV